MRKYSEISVRVPRDVFDLFIARVTELTASSWRRDQAAEESSDELLKYIGASSVFYIRKDKPQTDIVFGYKDEVFSLNNIFTTGRGISHAEHSRISKEFWNAGLEQACKELGLNGKYTPTKNVKPDEGLPPGVAQALKLFSLASNKSEGTGHPDDMERWCTFLSLLYASGVKFEEVRLDAYLTEAKFEDEIVLKLLGQYEMAMTLLPIHDSLRMAKAATTVQ